MTHEEIVRWYRLFRFDPQFRNASGAHTVPITEFLRFAGVNHSHFYRIVKGEAALTRNVHDRLVFAIKAIQDGLRWKPIRSGNKPGLTNGWVMLNPKKYQKMPRYERQNRPSA